MDAATARHVGRPKLRLPTSENTWLEIFLSFVHLTTSHGACGVSDSSCCCSCSRSSWLAIDDWRECGVRKAGESALGDCSGGSDKREEKRRSKGWSAPGLGLGTDSCDAGRLPPGEDSMEPCNFKPLHVGTGLPVGLPGPKVYRQASRLTPLGLPEAVGLGEPEA